MLQNCGFALKQLAVPVYPPQDHRAIKEIVKDHHGIGVGLAEPGSGGLAALGVQGTDNCEMHAAILLRSILNSK
ncbi:hypothetical protein StoSoilB22_29040 [Arthrobacter sp. StoSoilB22]|nr:hypothetical protein StoSoilB22_29040 [Arthrobacter sp. StoSoilB22]